MSSIFKATKKHHTKDFVDFVNILLAARDELEYEEKKAEKDFKMVVDKEEQFNIGVEEDFEDIKELITG